MGSRMLWEMSKSGIPSSGFFFFFFQAQVWTMALTLTTCVIWGKSLKTYKLSESPIPPLGQGHIYPTGFPEDGMLYEDLFRCKLFPRS